MPILIIHLFSQYCKSKIEKQCVPVYGMTEPHRIFYYMLNNKYLSEGIDNGTFL